jgi:hypothetical protein
LDARIFAHSRFARAGKFGFRVMRLRHSLRLCSTRHLTTAVAETPLTQRFSDVSEIAPDSLESLYLLHGGKVSDKWQSYLPLYDRLFRPLRRASIELLEIGVQNGGSLELWARYFQQATRIVGCDVNRRCGELSFEDPRIAVVVGDATLDETAEKIRAHVPSPQIVIDDGSHRNPDIIKAFARYFPSMADDGIYVAEDLHCSYWQTYQGGLFHPESAMSFFKKLADVTNHEHWGTAAARRDLVARFAERFGCPLDEDVLAQVHSVEFANSVCVVRKRPAAQNGLGRRVVAGKDAAVVALSAFEALAQRATTTPDQSANAWSVFPSPEDALEQQVARNEQLEARNRELGEAMSAHQAKIARLMRRNDSLAARVAGMEASRSWRITAPLRSLALLARRWRLKLAGKTRA